MYVFTDSVPKNIYRIDRPAIYLASVLFIFNILKLFRFIKFNRSA